MRTTIRLDDHLMAEVKKLAAATHRTITAVIEDALRETLARREEPKRGRWVKLPVVTGQKVRPGVDLDSSASLLDLTEGTD